MILSAGLLAACGSGSDSASSIPNVDPNRPSSLSELDPSPLVEFLGFDLTDADAFEAEVQDLNEQAEFVVAECMLAKGFEYQPVVAAAESVRSSLRTEGDGVEDFSDAWVDRYGFGVSTLWFSQEQVGPDLVGHLIEPAREAEEVSANEVITSSLSPLEREAYEQALWGRQGWFDPDSLDAPGSEGCQGDAFDEVFHRFGRRFEFRAAFDDELDALEAQTEADERVVSYREAVSNCVAGEGYRWDPGSDPYDVVVPEMQLIEAFSDALFATEPHLEAPLSDSDRELLAQVQAQEISLAKSVTRCGGGELNERYFVGQVRAEYETRFLEEHASEASAFAG